MKQPTPHEKLTDAQAAEVSKSQATQVEKQKYEMAKASDQAIRWRCVDAAIKAIDATPDLHIHSGDVSLNVSVVSIARDLYRFVTEE